MAHIRTATASLQTHCSPIDKNALREITSHVPQIFSTFECPELCAISHAEIVERHNKAFRDAGLHHKSNFRDLTGLRRGSVVVIGLIEYHEDGKSLWAVKCDCGRYEPRKHSRFWRNYRRGNPDYCSYCSPTPLKDQGAGFDGYRKREAVTL